MICLGFGEKPLFLTRHRCLWEYTSMNIEDLQETARLAHLTMDEQELGAAFPAFEQMLGFFAAMQAADEDTAAFPAGTGDFRVSGASLTVASDHFRQDTPHTQRLSERFLDNAGERDGNFVVVPNVL
jgi:aspartyl-tRNA(Asn)/glutamyl-tRNA(Gln) amidotransferase subunit C